MESLRTNNLINFVLDEWKLLSVLTISFLLYFHYTSTFSFFKRKGIKFMKPTIFFGNLGPRLALKVSLHESQLHLYNYFKGEPFGGFFEGRRPVLYLFDPELIKAVTIKDFDHFVDRNSLSSREPRYLSRSLLNLKGYEWKGVRSILTPSFSSTRLRNMLPLIKDCSNKMVDFLKLYDKKDVDMKNFMGRFTLEVVGACVFGIECDALTEKNARFVRLAEKFNDMPLTKHIFVVFVVMFIPQMIKYLNISFMDIETTQELVRMLNANKTARRSSQIKRNDFLQLLIDAADKEKADTEKDAKRYLDEDTLDAQSLLFLITGYETSSTLLSFALHALVTYPELQRELRSQVSAATEGKELTYELLNQLPYLEAFLFETLRMYPPILRFDRVVTQKYTLPGTSITLNPGQVVAIPVNGIHYDPDIYPKPLEFRPERFMGEEKKRRPSHLFLAFGAGPRNCIGYRFAILSAKLAMVTLIKNFQFTTCPKTEDPITFEKKDSFLKAQNGCWMKLETLV